MTGALFLELSDVTRKVQTTDMRVITDQGGPEMPLNLATSSADRLTFGDFITQQDDIASPVHRRRTVRHLIDDQVTHGL